jgi:hypothetical protein
MRLRYCYHRRVVPPRRSRDLGCSRGHRREGEPSSLAAGELSTNILKYIVSMSSQDSLPGTFGRVDRSPVSSGHKRRRSCCTVCSTARLSR